MNIVEQAAYKLAATGSPIYWVGHLDPRDTFTLVTFALWDPRIQKRSYLHCRFSDDIDQYCTVFSIENILIDRLKMFLEQYRAGKIE